jgi:ABC-2 type transport system permease protein
MLFQAVLLCWLGLTQTIFGDIFPLMEAVIKYGLFDRYLILPYPPIGIILTRGFNYRSSGTFLAGVIVLIYSIIKMNILISWIKVFLFIGFVFTGMLLYISFIIFYCTLALRLISVFRLRELLNNIILLGNFPVEVFSGFLKIIYLTVLPMAIWINFPTRILLGRLTPISFCSVVVSILLFLISLFVWKNQLKKYSSAGG